MPRTRGHRPHAGHGEQREGDLRRVRAHRQGPPEHRLQPVLRVRELPRPLPCHRPGTPGGIPRGARKASGLALAAYTSATGSAGTLAAGDWLKEQDGARIVAVEATECPTLLYNGYGEHNIQGIGDKHIPYIHNAMNTDMVAGVSITRPTRSTCSSTPTWARRISATAMASRRPRSPSWSTSASRESPTCSPPSRPRSAFGSGRTTLS